MCKQAETLTDESESNSCHPDVYVSASMSCYDKDVIFICKPTGTVLVSLQLAGAQIFQISAASFANEEAAVAWLIPFAEAYAKGVRVHKHDVLGVHMLRGRI